MVTMSDDEKTKDEFLVKLGELRRRIAELEILDEQRKRAQEALCESEFKFRRLAETISAIIFIFKEAKIRYVNPAAEVITGYTQEELLAMNFWDFFHPDFQDLIKERGLARQRGEKVPSRYELKIVTRDGDERWLDCTANTIEYEREMAGIVTAYDITERKQAEERLEHLNNVLRAIRNVNQLITQEKDRNRLLQGVCKNLIETRGYYNAWFVLFNESGGIAVTVEAGLGQDFLPIAERLQRGELTEHERRVLAQSGVVIAERGDVALTGKYRGKRAMTIRVEYEEKIYGLLTVTIPVRVDIDEEEQSLFKEVAGDVAFALHSLEVEEEHKRAEEALRESEANFRKLAETISATVFIYQGTKICYFNPAMQIITGYTPAEILGAEFWSFMHPGFQDLVKKQGLARLHGEEVAGRYETKIITKDGKERWLDCTAGLIEYHGEIAGIVTAYDITERKQAEEQIKASLKEKEVLLKEIHHRVKNNLQVIFSLLSLQSRYIKDKQIRNIFKESQNRIKTMALIHEKLYQSTGMAQIDFSEYINSLITHLFRSYEVNSHAITLEMNIDDVLLDVDTAIPCGMIINELVSNSLKYAFPNNSGGEVRFNFYKDKEYRYVMVIADNGAGFPSDVNFRETKSLGLQLVIMLTEQLGGTIELDSSRGTEFKIVFNHKV